MTDEIYLMFCKTINARAARFESLCNETNTDLSHVNERVMCTDKSTCPAIV